MSWTDKQAVEIIKYLRDKYKIKTFVETGTFKGINAEIQSKNFEYVFTCEKKEEYFFEAGFRLKNYDNVIIYLEDSSEFLKNIIKNERFIYYLDAHFYQKGCKTNKERFVVLNELESLKEDKKSIIIIHDFKHFLGGITYDNIDLDMNLLRKPLLKINPKFKFYTNTIEGCNPLTPNEVKDPVANDNIIYAWTAPRLTYRGILYCLPSTLNKKELKKLGLKEIK